MSHKPDHGLLWRSVFRPLWFSLLVSNIGNGMSFTAVPVFLYAHYGAGSVGLVTGALALSTLVTLPLAGRWRRSTSRPRSGHG